MTNAFLVGFGISMLLLAGLLYWLDGEVHRPHRHDRVKLSEAPVVYGISFKNAAVLIGTVGVLFVLLFGPAL